MDLKAIACGDDGQSQQRRLKPLLSRQFKSGEFLGIQKSG